MNKINGAQLCSRFAYKPNKLDYCGSTPAQAAIYQCIVYNKCQGLESHMQTFKGLNAYLNLFSRKFDKPIFDYASIEAYWIGNELLEEFKPDDFQQLVQYFADQSVPDFFLAELQEKFAKLQLPFYPHHSFNVFFVGVGNVTGSVEYNLKNINNCLIRSAKIIAINENEQQLEVETEEISQVEPVKWTKVSRFINFQPEFFNKLKTGHYIAIHWNDAVINLMPTEVKKLNYWNKLSALTYLS